MARKRDSYSSAAPDGDLGDDVIGNNLLILNMARIWRMMSFRRRAHIENFGADEVAAGIRKLKEAGNERQCWLLHPESPEAACRTYRRAMAYHVSKAKPS